MSTTATPYWDAISAARAASTSLLEAHLRARVRTPIFHDREARVDCLLYRLWAYHCSQPVRRRASAMIERIRARQSIYAAMMVPEIRGREWEARGWATLRRFGGALPKLP
jgi:hypothetical protein